MPNKFTIGVTIDDKDPYLMTITTDAQPGQLVRGRILAIAGCLAEMEGYLTQDYLPSTGAGILILDKKQTESVILWNVNVQTPDARPARAIH